MKTINKILGIGLIALIAMIGIGAVSAEPVERTVLGTEWNYDVVGDDGDYFIYDGTSDTAYVGGWIHDVGVSASGSETHYDPSPDHDDDHSDSVSKNVPGKNPNVGKQIDIRAKGIGYSDDEGVEYRDTIKSTTGGITVDDWNVDTRDGFGQYEYHFYKNEITGSTFQGNVAPATGGAIYYTNGMTGSLSDGNGNLLTRDVSGFVVPGSSIEPPRPDINIPYYPTEQTDIVLP